MNNLSQGVPQTLPDVVPPDLAVGSAIYHEKEEKQDEINAFTVTVHCRVEQHAKGF